MHRVIQRLIFVLVGVTLPMSAIAFRIGAIPVSLAKATVALMVILVAMQFGLSTHRRFPHSRGLLWLVVFVASVAISSVVSLVDGRPAGPVATAAARYGGLASFYLAIIYVVRTRTDVALLLWSLAIGGALTAVPSLLQIQSGTFLQATHRSTGLAGQPNLLGFELAICLAATFALYFNARGRFRKLLLLFIASLNLLAIVGSLSRSAFLSLAVMWAFWVWRTGRLDTLKYVVPGAALALALFFVLPEQARDRVDTMIDPTRRAQDGSIQGRFDQAYWTGRAFVQSPLVGVGLANSLPWMQRQPGGRLVRNSLHSAYMRLLAEQGLLGLLPFLGLVYVSWRDYSAAQRRAQLRRNRGDPELRELWVYALFLQIALLGCVVGTLTHEQSKSKGWWLVLGLSAVVVALVRARDAAIAGAPEAQGVEPTPGVGPAYGHGLAEAGR